MKKYKKYLFRLSYVIYANIFFKLLFLIFLNVLLIITISPSVVVYAAERDIGGMLVESNKPMVTSYPWFVPQITVEKKVNTSVAAQEAVLACLKTHKVSVSHSLGPLIPNTRYPHIVSPSFWYKTEIVYNFPFTLHKPPAFVHSFFNPSVPSSSSVPFPIPMSGNPLVYKISPIDPLHGFISHFINKKELINDMDDILVTKVLNFMDKYRNLIKHSFVLSNTQIDFDPYTSDLAQKCFPLFPKTFDLIYHKIYLFTETVNKLGTLWEQSHNPVFLHAMCYISANIGILGVIANDNTLNAVEILDRHKELYNDLYKQLVALK